MIAVVTGGSGFIGRNLVDRLLRDGHTVRCLVRRDGGSAPRRTERHVVDYRTPASLISSDAFEGADVVFHLAGATKGIAPGAFRDANVSTTRHLLGALAARRLRPRFVFVSSQAAAGPAASLERPVEERDTPAPVEEYGRSKLEAERVVAGFTDHLPTTVVRPCAVYGPRDRDFLNLFRFATRGWLPYPGVRDHWLSILHVDDAVEGMVRAATHDHAVFRTYFLSSAHPVQWRDLGAAIRAAMVRPVREMNLPQWLVSAAAHIGEAAGRALGVAPLANRNKARLGRHPYWVCSSKRARDELGFTEGVTLPVGIRETYLWYVTHGWLPGRSDRRRPNHS